jgi:hypothetical protein
MAGTEPGHDEVIGENTPQTQNDPEGHPSGLLKVWEVQKSKKPEKRSSTGAGVATKEISQTSEGFLVLQSITWRNQAAKLSTPAPLSSSASCLRA